MKMSATEIFDIVLYQIAAVKGICEAFGRQNSSRQTARRIYNQAAKDANLAEAIAEAVKAIDDKFNFIRVYQAVF